VSSVSCDDGLLFFFLHCHDVYSPFCIFLNSG
jgi:hypothetical protein